MVITNGSESGTFKVGSSTTDSSYVAPFLSQFNKEQPKAPSKYSSVSTDDLKKMVAELDLKMEREISVIKEKYSKQKKDMEATLRRKQKK